jgi:hypothetical protein
LENDDLVEFHKEVYHFISKSIEKGDVLKLKGYIPQITRLIEIHERQSVVFFDDYILEQYRKLHKRNSKGMGRSGQENWDS